MEQCVTVPEMCTTRAITASQSSRPRRKLPFKALDYTVTGVDGSNAGFEPNLVNHKSPEHSDSRRAFLVRQYGCFILDPWQGKAICYR